MSGNPFLDMAGIAPPAIPTPPPPGGSSRYTGGWTPRARNGGDNPDPVVDNKIAGAAKFLGVDPDEPVSHLSPAQIAQAMTLSEGGRGSLADRNNNPGNLKNPDGSFKRFPTREAGLAAAGALVQHKLQNGQTTVRSLIEGVPQGGAAQAPVEDQANPFLDAAGIGKGGGGDVPDTPTGQAGQNSGGVAAGLPANGVDGGQVLPQPGQRPEAEGGLRGGTSQDQGGETRLTSFGHGLSDVAVGALSGIDSLAGTAETIGGKYLDLMQGRLPGSPGSLGDMGAADAKSAHDAIRSHLYNPNGWAQFGGELGGSLAGAGPISKLEAFTAKEGSNALAQALAKYGNYAAQGAAGGIALSDGQNMGQNAAIGGALGPVVGVAVEKVIAPPLVKGAQVAEPYVSPALAKLKAAMSDRFGKVPEVDPATLPDKPAWLMSQAEKDAQAVAELQAQVGDEGLVGVVHDTSAASKKRGIEAEPLHPDAKAQADELTAQGVDPAHAANEAAIRYVGAEPTVASSTRSFTAQQAENEAAKETGTSAGMELRARRAANNQALHEKVAETVNNYGGVPAQGDAAEGAATSLAKASDAEKTKVNALYTAADEKAAQLKSQSDIQRGVDQQLADAEAGKQAQAAARAKLDEAQQALRDARKNAGDIEGAREGVAKARDSLRSVTDDPPAAKPVPKGGDGYIDVSDFTKALSDPEILSPTVEGAATLKNGLLSAIKSFGKGTNTITLKQSETLRQLINDAYDIKGGSINNVVGRVKSSLDRMLDNASTASEYKAARAAHKAWAEKYDDPSGLERLIRRDAQGNFSHSDNWRQAENGLIGTASDKAFAQTVRQLKANGDTEALDRLKADIVQRAYQKAKGTATDESGHGTFSAAAWHATLDTIGLKKLKLLFSPDEIAHLATIGRAAHALNSPMKDSFNSSGTSSMILNALRAREDAAKGGKGGIGSLLEGAAQAAAGHSVPVVGNLAVSLASKGIGKAATARTTGKVNEQLAKAIRLHMDPSAYRAAANENIAKVVAKGSREALARALAGRSAAGAGSIKKDQ